ncbi:MAG: MOSC N-terminal beta barrel domain-containing protein [Cocleimonas sp.]|nr:MOSC N-terminal beta barrel domain-containing protein [Cocleimonas sp.]
MPITVSELYIYPVKSLAGIAIDNSKIDAMGLMHDRRWMLVSPAGDFLSQRKFPQMALIQPTFIDQQLILTSANQPDLLVATADAQHTMQVTIWKDTVTAQRVGEQADKWLSKTLGTPCHLVYIPDNEIRQCDPEFAQLGDHTGFADGFPILLISTASLEDLNQRLDQPVSMKHFRPNIVVEGCHAFAEDSLNIFSIGNVAMRGVKPCSRCILTTVDPATGTRTGMEPLQTLMRYRKQGNNVNFGQNVIHNSMGSIQIGNSIIES